VVDGGDGEADHRDEVVGFGSLAKRCASSAGRFLPLGARVCQSFGLFMRPAPAPRATDGLESSLMSENLRPTISEGHGSFHSL
jgi:hypothetical protein